jgi:predicted ArsR family transcriptional regulator
MRRSELGKKIYEYIRVRGCATVEEIAQALNVSDEAVRILMRSLIARQLVLPYRSHVGRERMYCVPEEGDRLYGQNMRVKTSGIISITMPVDLIEIIDEIAAETGQTRSEVIRQAVMELIANYRRQQQSEDPQEEEKPDFITPIR